MAVKQAKPTAFLDFDIVGSQRGVQQMLEHIDSALSPVGLVVFLHGAVQPWLIERAKQRFADEGDDAVGKWAPLQQSTVEIRESQGFEGTHPINKRTGELEAYITQGEVDIVASPGMASLRFPGRNAPSRAVMEKLSTAQRGRTSPATVPRPVLGLGEKDLAYVVMALALHVQRWRR